ncbi:hypothetical protein ACIP9H_33740 [Streptomyces sp. NPDC088732]|uniref:hypothetical protein n=1 Tax=Streptomyces sp. NPDC088732 TaxID=3365879 RepID=UPI00380E01E0
MTRYGFAIKALPKGSSKPPFGKDKPDDEELLEDPAAAPQDAAATEPPADTPAAPSAPQPDDTAGAPADDTAANDVPAPTDDTRPWSGDMYDEGDETDPAQAYAAYTGSNGEEAWLDQAPDGTLTGWVRDSTGQVWRYSDVDAWAIDVDDAQMTRTHSSTDGTDAGSTAPSGSGQQDQMFPPL